MVWVEISKKLAFVVVWYSIEALDKVGQFFDSIVTYYRGGSDGDE